MGSKKTMRVVLDAILTVMIVFEMFIQFTGEFLHEVIGFAFFATVVAHLLLSAKWIKNTAQAATKKGKMKVRRKVLAIMGILLAVNMLVLGVSSIAISNLLADAGFTWTLGSYATWATIHAVSSYSLCALVALHLGMHWVFLASALHVPYDPERRRAIGTGVNAVAAVGAIALGVMAVNEVIPSSANANSANQSTSNNSTSNSGSSSSSSGSGPTQPSARNDKPGTAPSSSSGSTDTQNSNGSSSNASGGTSSDSSNGSSSSATGICTLCRKRCPLSAPQCDKPYEAGLI